MDSRLKLFLLTQGVFCSLVQVSGIQYSFPSLKGSQHGGESASILTEPEDRSSYTALLSQLTGEVLPRAATCELGTVHGKALLVPELSIAEYEGACPELWEAPPKCF